MSSDNIVINNTIVIDGVSRRIPEVHYRSIQTLNISPDTYDKLIILSKKSKTNIADLIHIFVETYKAEKYPIDTYTIVKNSNHTFRSTWIYEQTWETIKSLRWEINAPMYAGVSAIVNHEFEKYGLSIPNKDENICNDSSSTTTNTTTNEIKLSNDANISILNELFDAVKTSIKNTAASIEQTNRLIALINTWINK